MQVYLTRLTSVYGARPYSIARCERCGGGKTDPMPTAEELEAVYGKAYDYDVHALIAEEKRWRSRALVDGLLEGRVASALDIGCMHGYLMEALKERGVARIVGIERSGGAARVATGKGLDVHIGDVESYASGRPEPFDLIVAQHVIEHVTDPVSFLRSAHALLNPGGRIVLAVPHMGSRTQRLFKRTWGWWQVPVHLYHFSPQSLGLVLEKSGFVQLRKLLRGGDSLFILLSLLYAVSPGSTTAETGSLGLAKQAMIRAASKILRPYCLVGDEELVVIAERKPA
jgi:SAM-dependent methyltransferase